MIQVLKKWNAILGHCTEVKHATIAVLKTRLEGKISPRSGKVFFVLEEEKKKETTTQNPSSIPQRKMKAWL